MPVSGRPMKAALLKTSQGSSGLRRKGFQSISNSPGAGSEPPARTVGASFLALNDDARTASVATRITASAIDTAFQRPDILRARMDAGGASGGMTGTGIAPEEASPTRGAPRR